MKIPALLMGVVLCLAPHAVNARGQDDPIKRADPQTKQSLTGCVDQQYGQYVLLDDQMVKITALQSSGADQNIFAKFVGRKVTVRGTKSSGPKASFTVTGVEQVADTCSPAK